MPVPTASFLLGLVVLGYLLTFIVFAILRVITGVSIQRVGYSGFRRIAFSPRHGVKVTIRGVGLSPHRPTFALPTWCSLVITELVVSVDLKVLEEGKNAKREDEVRSKKKSKEEGGQEKASGRAGENEEQGRGRLWRKLMEVKEKIKRLHGKIHWLRLVDLVADAAEVNIVGVGSLRIEKASLSVDTRSQTVDRSRLFQHHKSGPETKRPAEWKSMVRSVLFTPEGRDSTEVLDYCQLNIHGLLHRELQGLRDASIALKLGRLNVPYDDIEHAKKSAELIRGRYAQSHGAREDNISLSDALDEMEQPGSREERIVQTVSDSRAFIASILRGIQEVQLAVGFLGFSSKLSVKTDSGADVYFNLAMKEVGLDILRLDPKTPAHRMYFARDDVAHQGLLTAISIAAGIDDGHERPERMVYVPMITATIKNTLPARTLHYSKNDSAGERNSNILHANFVCTSPSIDLDPKHLPLVLQMLKNQKSSAKQPKRSNSHRIISQLLPKATVKLSIQEPVIRVSLPPMDKNAEPEDYDLLISSVSSMSLEVESSHSPGDNSHYNLASNYRHTTHQLYYQTAIGERHDLMQSDTVEFKVDMNAIPGATVTAFGRFQTFTIYLVRPDICEGVRQIVKQLRNNILQSSKRQGEPQPQVSFLRRMPAWLKQFRLEGHEFALQLAGVDANVSQDTRGFGLELETWIIEYKANRDDVQQVDHRRRSSSRVSMSMDRSAQSPARSGSPRRKKQNATDGRRLTVHVQNLDGLIIDSVDSSQADPFMSLPRFETAFSTSTDAHGPIFHINSHARSLLLHYSLYNHFAMGMAIMVVKRTFLDHDGVKKAPQRPAPVPTPTPQQSHLRVPGSFSSAEEVANHEIMTVDFKASLIQVKATLPSDPPMMLQIFGLEAGQHRWASAFFRNRLTRLYVRAPSTKSAWSRIVSLKSPRLDLRDIKRRQGTQTTVEKSLDLTLDAIHIGVPHQLLVHSIFDNITNIIKTSKQLQHHFATGNLDDVLKKAPEGPKNVPRVSLRTQLLIFEVEDSSFEWKLGAIYRAGLLEQKQRLTRDELFKAKEKKLRRGMRKDHRRARSTHMASRSRSNTRGEEPPKRSSSSHPTADAGSQRAGRRRMRYDADGRCGISDNSTLSIEQAQERLHRLNADTWKNRIDRVLNFQQRTMRNVRSSFWGSEDVPDDIEQHEPILGQSQRPALLSIAISNLAVTVDKPSFPAEDLPKFLNDVGKGMPRNMQYGLLVPMSLHVTTGEAKVQLRDYPLPLIHVPALANGQSPRLPSMSLRTDFVIAEEFRDYESQKEVTVIVVPKEKMGQETDKELSFTVRRTISPVKTYSDMKFEIHTGQPTKITWGTSFQPAIQDAMQCIEGFTKPPIDPSDRVGFWDKIRLSFHSRVNVAWKGDGDVHLVLKGSRDPYVVTGDGAGLVMVWRNDVRWNIAQHEDPRQFMTVDSGDYILAVPDFNKYARFATESDRGDENSSSGSSSGGGRDAIFKKVIMKLSGQVRWMAGLMFERDLPDGSRTFKFKPHYDVVTKHPNFAKAPEGGEYDAFRDFRSHHIHMSIAIAAPHSRDWSVSNLKPSNNYNSLHLTPRFFSHFFSWWSMFSGIMSLPIKQGPLWGVTQKKSKKFGRHIATIKYNLLLSPLFVSHLYKHKDAEEYADDGSVSATGLKMRLDSFMLDLHQRREFFDIKGHDDAAAKRSSGMRINQAQVDFISADLRAVSASIRGTSAQEMEKATEETLAGLSGPSPQVNLSRFTIPDNDFTWIDMDDFVELDWVLPAESDPETKILPLGYAPRFTYFRQTDHGDSISGDTTRSSPFGDELTHYCVMSGKNDPRRVQAELISSRLQALKAQRESNEKAENDQELKMIKSLESDINTEQEKMQAIRIHGEQLKQKERFLKAMLEALSDRLEHDDPSAVPELETADEFYEAYEDPRTPMADPDMQRMDSTPLADYTSDFNNRFIVHNPQIKWNNSLRNIILRYIHQNSQRRGFVYYMSQRAVKFIVDILEEQKKKEGTSTPTREKSWTTQGPGSPDMDDDMTVQDRIEELLRDGRNYVNADDPGTEKDEEKTGNNGPTDEISHEFTPLNTYHFRLIAPQIQLHSEKNPKSAVLVTAKGMQLKVVQIMDKDRVNDEVSGLVQRRFTAAMDSLQMFVTSTKTFSTEYLRMYSGNRYGVKTGTCWPPWVPLEIMFEYEDNPYGFNRVVHRTSASLRYDKYNTLRLKYNDDVSGGDNKTTKNDEETENRMDHVWVEFPQFRAICDSAQYFALYIIVMDLLLYSEPLEKTRSERLEKIMLASDFSDLTGAPEMVQMLQGRIRQLEEIKMQFQVHEKYLDRQGWKDRITMDQDLASCEDELFFMMKAITTAQQRLEDRREQENAAGLLHLNMSAKEIAWHLIRDKGESLMEFQLKNASFDRTDNNDGSNYNCMEIGRINGLNLLPDALYPEIIGPYVDPPKGYPEPGNNNMLRVQWLMLDAIAGIPVVDYFEVDLVPLKLQLERDIAKKLFEYIFPGVGGNAFDGAGFSPFIVRNMLPPQEEEDEEENETLAADKPSADSEFAPEPGNGENVGTGAGSLERRLVPTLHLPKQKKAKVEKDGKGLGISGNGHHTFHGFGGLFQHSDRSRSQLNPRTAASKAALSQSNLSPAMARSPSQRSVNTARSDPQSVETEKTKRFAASTHRSSEDKKRGNERSDDLTEMMNRASNYMTLAFVKIPSMVLCLSYKGKGHRNIEDVHDLVFRMPTLEYRNKTWSNLDLALSLKKDVIRALISHAGAIVGNKFSNHKPTRQQVSRLRELANMSTLLKDSNNSSHASSASGSTHELDEDYAKGRPSTASARPSTLSRSVSFNSTPSLSGGETDQQQQQQQQQRPATSGGRTNGDRSEAESNGSPQRDSPSRHLEPPDPHRSRTASISRRLTGGFSQRSRQDSNISTMSNGNGNGDDTEENSRKSKLLLGGQKFLRSLRD